MPDLVTLITDVMVYADRAFVTRKGSVELEEGEHELWVNDLPELLRESLRAAGQGPQGTRILDIDIRKTFYSRPPEEELLKLRTTCDLLQQQLDLVKARKESLNDRRQWLRALGEHSREFAKGLASGQMKAQDCADFFSFTATQSLRDAETGLDLDLQTRQLEEELSARRRELASKQGHGQSDRLAAVITVAMPEAGTFALELSYLIMKASWHPQYDVRVSPGEDGNRGEVEVTYIGLVQQATGENWSQVNLALSTARPSQAAALPELQPRYLQIYTPMPMMASAPMSAAVPSQPMRKAARLRMSHDGSKAIDGPGFALEAEEFAASEPVPAEVAIATTEQSGTASVFKIARSVDIPSDNSPHKTTIARDRLPCEFDYVSAPSLDPSVHQRARITNTTERALLPGACSIFLQGEYVGTTRVKLTAPREQFKIFLGIDDTLKVKREQIERTVEKGALLQGDLRRITYAYRITLHNYTAFARNIVLRDHLPLSQHERIKVKVQSIQPQPTERTRLELLTWRFNLPADGDYRLEYRYTVEHPQDVEVVGLP